ncbi:MAG: ATP-binding protein [Deltaproteobacteria bacterium]|nr:ATP-binding protein [Deltaproteobacteria bacterium]
MTLQHFPLGDPSFRKLRAENRLYVDKTEYISKMLNLSTCCFLSRPRRFGKSLLLSTIDELFQGDRKLFNGLWIDSQHNYSFEKHPVLNFNMGYSRTSTDDELITAITDDLEKHAKREGVALSSHGYGEMLGDLLQGIYFKHGVGTVILVDEYDAPVTDHLSDMKLAYANRTVLHNFYRSLKASLKYVHFAFVTGISRLAMTSMDSGPNNFTDISLMPEFSGICGFTAKELNKYFKARFKDTLTSLKANGDLPKNAGIKELKAIIMEWYDGYNWLGNDHILNPYSILNFFLLKNLDSYWPSSGRPSHLIALIRENLENFLKPRLDDYPVSEITKADVLSIGIVPIMFHSGYLTIDNVTKITRIENQKVISEKVVSFRTPNLEIQNVSLASVFKDIFKLRDDYLSDITKNFPVALLDKNVNEVIRLLTNLLSTISYMQHPTTKEQATPDPDLKTEKMYHNLFHAAFFAAGFTVISEVPVSKGRSDITLLLKDNTYVVIELKYCFTGDKTDDKIIKDKELAQCLDGAENQMIEKNYVAPYRVPQNKVIGLAMAVRKSDEVAVRFVDLDAIDVPSDS